MKCKHLKYFTINSENKESYKEDQIIEYISNFAKGKNYTQLPSINMNFKWKFNAAI